MGRSQTSTSVSTLQCTNQGSFERRTVPRIPIRQCSIVGENRVLDSSSFSSEVGGKSEEGVSLFVLSHTISSHRLSTFELSQQSKPKNEKRTTNRYPQFANNSRPLSNPTPSFPPLPTQSQMNPGVLATLPKSNPSNSSYPTSGGGVSRMTS